MNCIVYVSREAAEFDEQALADLASFAAERNKQVGITGYLYYNRCHFTQYIEGDPEPLEKLWNSINLDSRHSVVISDQTAAEHRRFNNWHMKRISTQQLIEIQLEHVLTDHLLFLSRLPSPNLHDPQSLWRMVDALAKQQRLL